eukprot:CAMPEP_0117469412 /NCGR_PEP_ID=MMETSP0784-20121206/6676_1 /TAXON_ID=39447 /ORGANISM="" /LENGTH=330 /DNA_ID=CAMNT_0005263447 /DNA_START=348 /DNA_END=1340 /DNA_ORIENTATION=+
MKHVKLTSDGIGVLGCTPSTWLSSDKFQTHLDRLVFGAPLKPVDSQAWDQCSKAGNKALIQMPWDTNNLYEWFGDWVSLFETLELLRWKPEDFQIFLIADEATDMHKRPFDEAWFLAFQSKVVRIGSYKSLFGGAGLCFAHVATVPMGGVSTITFAGGRGGEVQCASSTVMGAARFLSGLFLPASTQGKRGGRGGKSAVLLLRKVSTRKFVDDREAVKAVSSALGQGWKLTPMSPEAMPNFADQISPVSSADLLIGVHGAGMTLSLFLPRDAHLVEFFCEDRGPENHHYMNLETMSTGHHGQYHFSDRGSSCTVDTNTIQEAVAQQTVQP